SKRSPDQDLIAEGFSDELLAERLKRQHRLICAAIHSGRIDDLKKMSGRPKAELVPQEAVETTEAEAEPETDEVPPAPVEEPFEIEYWPMTQEWAPPPPAPPREEVELADDSETAPRYEPVEDALQSVDTEEVEELELESALPDGLYINILDDDEFYSGKRYTLRVLITNVAGGEEKPLSNVAVSVKV